MRALKRRALLLAVFFVLASLQSFAQQTAPVAAPQSKRQFIMWKVTSPTSTVYLVGSMHLIRKDVYPLPAQVETAFAQSKALVVEINMAALDQSKMVALVQQYGVYSGEDALSNHISKQTSAELDEFCAKYGLPRANLEKFKPWMVSTLVALLPLQKAGADPTNGIDMHFIKEVKPPQHIDELETPEFQMSIISSGTEQEQDVGLDYALKHAEEVKEMEAEYLAGDMDGMMKRISDSPSKAMIEKLLYARNPNMTAKIEGYLKGNETVFVVVGAAHVIGDKGIAHALESKNYKVEKIAMDW